MVGSRPEVQAHVRGTDGRWSPHNAHFTTPSQLHNYFQIDYVLDRVGEEVPFRNANFMRNASPFVVDNIESAVLHVAIYAQTQGGI